MAEQQKSDGKRSGDSERKRSFQRPGKSRRGGQQFRQDDDFNWNKVLKVVLSWSAIILLVFLMMKVFKATEEPETEISYTEYEQLLKSGQIEKAIVRKSELTNFDFHGELKSSQNVGEKKDVRKFTLTLPFIDSGVIDEWTKQGIQFRVVKDDNAWINALISFLP